MSENLKVGHLTSMAAATRSWALAYLCIFHLPQQFGQVHCLIYEDKLSFDYLMYLCILYLLQHFNSLDRFQLI